MKSTSLCKVQDLAVGLTPTNQMFGLDYIDNYNVAGQKWAGRGSVTNSSKVEFFCF